MIIFAFRARPGKMRTGMLLCDGAALLIPVLLGVWLITLLPPPSARSDGRHMAP